MECQIYVFFPLLVLLRNRLGRWPTLVLWFVAVRALEFLAEHNGHSGYSFLLLIFAEGMLGADLAFRPAFRRWLLPGTVLSAAGTVLTFEWHKTIAESLLGLTVALLMAYFTQTPASVGNKILGWKPLAWIGTFSYSIYLVHSYIEICAARWLSSNTKIWDTTSNGEHAAFLVLLTPIILLLSYCFHIVFERPFMGTARQHAEQRLVPISEVNPANSLQDVAKIS